MIRLAGSICILSGGVVAVWKFVQEQRQKRELLLDLIAALRRMEEEIHSLRTPLPRLIEEQEKQCRTEARLLFQHVSLALKKGKTLSTAWVEGCEQLSLEREEMRVMKNVVCGGNVLCDSMCNAISLAYIFLEKQLEEQDKGRAEQTKRTAALYLSGAALLVILLI